MYGNEVFLSVGFVGIMMLCVVAIITMILVVWHCIKNN